jgi:hypothetical protein
MIKWPFQKVVSSLIDQTLLLVLQNFGWQLPTLPFLPASYTPAFMFVDEYFCPILFDEFDMRKSGVFF